jgi:methyl-accepting chemotaxis protein
MFKNLSISAKLYVFAAFISLIAIGIGAHGLYGISQANERLQRTLEASLADIKALQALDHVLFRYKEQVQDWKNILIRGHDQTGYDRYLSNFKKKQDTIRSEIESAKKAFEAADMDPAPLTSVEKSHREVYEKYLTALTAFKVGKEDTTSIVDRSVRGIDQPVAEALDKLSEKVEAHVEEGAVKEREKTVAAYNESRLVAIVSITIAVLLLFLSAHLFRRAILTPLNRAVSLAQAVAAGDLSTRIVIDRHDEFGSLLTALQEMNDSLTRIVEEVRSGGEAITSAAQQVSTGNTDLSQRTEEQASMLEETASNMEELTATVRQNSDNALRANEVTRKASEIAAKGGTAVDQVVTTMGTIQDSSRRIVDIISVIDGIAFQTNILALNAAVEAARAGEQGRGFAVVASEVRNLAQRSADAAKQIKTLIGDSVEKVDNGTRLVEQAGGTIKEIVEAVSRVTTLMAEISAASSEQSSGIEQVNQAVMQMDQVVQQNAALVEEAAAAAESMQEQAQFLHRSVSFFRLADASERRALSRDISRHGEREPSRRTAAPTRQPARLKKDGRSHSALPSSKPESKLDVPAKLAAGARSALPVDGGDDDWKEF